MCATTPGPGLLRAGEAPLRPAGRREASGPRVMCLTNTCYIYIYVYVYIYIYMCVCVCCMYVCMYVCNVM